MKTSQTYYCMSEKQRKDFLCKFQNYRLPSPRLLAPPTITTPSSANDTKENSISLVNLKSNLMPISIVKKIESSANKLNQDDGSILKGFGGCFYIGNRKNRECPFIVCEKKKGYFTCSAACHRFKSFTICRHVVAVAHSIGKLEEVIKSVNAKNKKINVSRICDRDKEMLAGKKLSKKRKGAANSVPFVPKSMISPHGQQFTLAFASTPRDEVSSTPSESNALGNAKDLLLNLSNDDSSTNATYNKFTS